MTESYTFPNVTLVLFCYNQAEYIRDAVTSALAQTYHPLTIVISDDSSTDNTFDIVEDIARKYIGPHKVVVNRNTNNMGIGAHVNHLMSLASGDIVVVAAGDDISHPERVALIMEAFAANPDCYLVHSAAQLIDRHGAVTGDFEPAASLRDKPTLDAMASGNLAIIGATGAWRREVFGRFGPLHDGVVCEDLIIPFRAVMLGGVSYISKTLVQWRRIGVSSDFQPKSGHDVLFGRWIEWQRIWRDAYRDRINDLVLHYGDAAPRNVMTICEREYHRYDTVLRLAAARGTIRRLREIGRLLGDHSLPRAWRAKTGLIYLMPRLYSAFYDWKMRRGIMTSRLTRASISGQGALTPSATRLTA